MTVSSGWSLTPSSLNPGDRFRLMFLTTSRNATPKGIDVYNEWVQGRAAGGHDAIREYAGAFNLLGCTEDDDARDNTGTTYTSGSSSPASVPQRESCIIQIGAASTAPRSIGVFWNGLDCKPP